MAFPTCVPDATNVATPAESDNIFCIQAEIRAIKEYLRDNAFAEVPVGAYTNYLGVEAPVGWLFAAQEVSRTTYADLFAILDTSYGEGNGSNTFDLPALYDVAGGATEVSYSDLPTFLTASSINELPDGRLLSIGGFDGSSFLASVYFGTITGTGATKTITWASGTALPSSLAYHNTVITHAGDILVIGGQTGSSTSSTLYKGVISGNTIVWTSTVTSYFPGSIFDVMQGHGNDVYITGYNLANLLVIDTETLTIRLMPQSRTLDAMRTSGCRLKNEPTYATYLLLGTVPGVSTARNCYIVTIPSTGILATVLDTTPLPVNLYNPTVTALIDGRVLVIGNTSNTYGAAPTAYIGTIINTVITWELVTTTLAALIGTRAAFYACTRLLDGSVMLAGGTTIASGTLKDIKSWRPSRVIIKT